MPKPKAEIQPVRTGVADVDRELARRTFASSEEAEAVANRLLAAWRGLTQPDDTGMLRWQRRK
jgi:hypothetical protein